MYIGSYKIIWKECISYISSSLYIIIDVTIIHFPETNAMSSICYEISQACIFDVFIWIVCHRHRPNKSIFLLMGKSSWDPQNTNTMQYKCCYASINMLYKKEIFSFAIEYLLRYRKHLALVLLCTHHTIFFRHPLKRILDQLQVFLFLFTVYIFLWQSKKKRENKSIYMYSWLHIHLPTHLLSILRTN